MLQSVTSTNQIDEYIANLQDWRGVSLNQYRKLICQTSPELAETWKWSVPVFVYKNTPVIAISAFKNHVKIKFNLLKIANSLLVSSAEICYRRENVRT